jgi:hypothetical protein
MSLKNSKRSDGLLGTTRKEEEHRMLSKSQMKILVIAIVLFLGIFLTYHLLLKTTTRPFSKDQSVEQPRPPLPNAQVLKIAAQEQITKDFISRNPQYDAKVTFLDVKTLQSLAVSTPAIYADLLSKENGIYKVEYIAKEEGIMLLLDPKTKTVLKYYRVKTIHL